MAGIIVHSIPGSPFARAVLATLVPQLDFLAQSPEWTVLTAGLANLVDWFQRTSSRPSFQATTWEQVAKAAA